MKLSLDAVYKALTVCNGCEFGTVVEGRPVCSGNSEIRFFDPDYACPRGLWKHEIIYMHGISQPRADMASVVHAPEVETSRKKARTYWESLADLTKKAVQMAQVVTSGTAPEDVIAVRRSSCVACPARQGAGGAQVPIGATLESDQWCGDCGCGTQPWAKLDGKLTYAYLPCPRQRPGFSNAES